MARGIFSGFVCGAVVGVIALAVWSQAAPLPAGPAPVVPVEPPARAPMPGADAAPVLPAPQTAP